MLPGWRGRRLGDTPHPAPPPRTGEGTGRADAYCCWSADGERGPEGEGSEVRLENSDASDAKGFAENAADCDAKRLDENPNSAPVTDGNLAGFTSPVLQGQKPGVWRFWPPPKSTRVPSTYLGRGERI